VKIDWEPQAKYKIRAVDSDSHPGRGDTDRVPGIRLRMEVNMETNKTEIYNVQRNTDQERIDLGNGRYVMHHSKEDCQSPCALHAPLPGPWSDWKLDWAKLLGGTGVTQLVRRCPKHHYAHPTVESLVWFARRGESEQARHICCGCPCVPDGVLSDDLRVIVSLGAQVDPVTAEAEQEPEPVSLTIPLGGYQIQLPPGVKLGDALKPGDMEWINNRIAEAKAADHGDMSKEEPETEDDPLIDIASLGTNWKTMAGKSVVRLSEIREKASDDNKNNTSRLAHRQLLKAYLEQQPAKKSTFVPELKPVNPEPDPNKVAQSFLSNSRGKMDSMLHEALTLLCNRHDIINVEKRPQGASPAWTMNCESDCSDYFDAGKVATDDNDCVTLKIAIVGGWQPVEWNKEDDGE
jgi:hypothetical protein